MSRIQMMSSELIYLRTLLLINVVLCLNVCSMLVQVFINSVVNEEVKSTIGISTTVKAILDSKRRHDLVDEAFSEQKDILLDMLEAKLKEVRNRKQKKTDPDEFRNAIVESIKCDVQPNEVDLNIKGKGIIAVGETDTHLRFGKLGNSILNLNATGISNIGKTYVDLNIGDGYPNIPGLNDLLFGPVFSRNPCHRQRQIKNDDSLHVKVNEGLLRKGLELSNSSIAKSFANVTNNTVVNEGSNKTKALHAAISTSTSSKSMGTSLKSTS